MKIRTGKYFVREGLKSLWRNKTMSAASISSVAAALIVIGLFLILMLNINYLAAKLESQVEVRVFLKDGLSENIISSLKKDISSLDGVKSVVFESKAQALEKIQKEWGDNSSLLEGLEGDNPFPDSFIITLKDPKLAKNISMAVSSMSNIEKVDYGKDILDKLLKTTYLIRLSSLVIVLVLVFISVFIISNTIKLTVFARRREIGIMKYVGATDWFVRGPFFVEGMLLGIIGSIISVFLLSMGYLYCTDLLKEQMIGLLSISVMPFKEVVGNMSLLLFVIGIFIGSLGSMVSIRKFLKV